MGMRSHRFTRKGAWQKKRGQIKDLLVLLNFYTHIKKEKQGESIQKKKKKEKKEQWRKRKEKRGEHTRGTLLSITQEQKEKKIKRRRER